MEKFKGTFSDFQAQLANDYGVPYGVGEEDGYTSDIVVENLPKYIKNNAAPFSLI